MRKAYSRIAWGLALELIDFRLGSFDVFPDFLGYFLIMLGLSGLHSKHRYFTIAWGAAGIQLVLSMLQLLGLQMGFSLTNYETPALSVLGLTSIVIAIDLIMVYGICGGIRANALERRKVELAHSARSGWPVLFVFGAMMLFLLPFQLNFTKEEGIGYALFFSLGYFAASIWLILLVRRAGRELSGGGSSGEPNGNLGQSIDVIA
jgi:hypothetical protein